MDEDPIVLIGNLGICCHFDNMGDGTSLPCYKLRKSSR